MSTKTILILGGGVGGLVTANELRRYLPPQHRIVVIDRQSHRMCSGDKQRGILRVESW